MKSCVFALGWRPGSTAARMAAATARGQSCISGLKTRVIQPVENRRYDGAPGIARRFSKSDSTLHLRFYLFKTTYLLFPFRADGIKKLL